MVDLVVNKGSAGNIPLKPHDRENADNMIQHSNDGGMSCGNIESSKTISISIVQISVVMRPQPI